MQSCLLPGHFCNPIDLAPFSLLCPTASIGSPFASHELQTLTAATGTISILGELAMWIGASPRRNSERCRSMGLIGSRRADIPPGVSLASEAYCSVQKRHNGTAFRDVSCFSLEENGYN